MKITELKDLEEDSAPPQGAGDAALALGLERARMGDLGLAADTAVYLRKQSQMLDLQMENLHEQRLIQLNHLKRRELIDRLKVSLQILAIAFGVLVVGLAGYAVFDASRSRALVIEPISGTDELAQRGLTSEVMAAQLLDKLRAMQARTDSARAPDTFQSNWGDEIEIEVPQTGVSISELMQALRRWLGHDTHITGETFLGDQGLTLTARVGTLPGRTYFTSDGKLDTLMQRAAEAIYADTQPYRYSVYLSQNDRGHEAIEVLQRVADRGPTAERAWAYIGLGGQYGAMGDLRRAAVETRRGLELNPNLAAGWTLLAGIEGVLGHDEGVLKAMQRAEKALSRGDRGGITPRPAAQSMWDARATLAELRGDFRGAALLRSGARRLPGYQYAGSTASALEALNRIQAHEALDPFAVALQADDIEAPVYRARLIAAAAANSGDWAGAIPAIEKVMSDAAGQPGAAYRSTIWPVQVSPWLAFGYARTGQMDKARALISRTPQDCYLCLRARAWIAEIGGDRSAADAWFAKAVQAAPSLPFAYGEWGQVLAVRGQVRAAEARFRQARSRGPDWAEPLVWWGQSLSRRGRTGEAELRFAAAAKLAPEWKAIATMRRPEARRASAPAG